LLAVAAAEQEDEPLQVGTQLAQAVGGVTDELCQRRTEAGRVASQPFTEESQHLGQLGRRRRRDFGSTMPLRTRVRSTVERVT
jgi:hypothetical protein